MATALPTKPKCNVKGCNTPAKSRGICQNHYMQLRNHGYDVRKVKWFSLIKDNKEAMNLLSLDKNPIQHPAPVATLPTQVQHDAWVAAYAWCQSKGISMDEFQTGLVEKWYRDTFPRMASGAAPAVNTSPTA